MHSLLWKKQANNDLVRIVRHIAEDNPDAAESLAIEIQAKVEQLKTYPKLARLGCKRGTREFVVHVNYLVIYRIQDNTVEILRVKHTAQQWP